MACTASWRETGENNVAHEMVWTSSRHFRYTSLGGPPQSRTFAETIHMAVTANGERSLSESYVSTLASKIGRKVEHPW